MSRSPSSRPHPGIRERSSSSVEAITSPFQTSILMDGLSGSLGAPQRMLGRPGETVRGWLRRFAGRAEEVRVFFTVLLAATAPDPVMPAGAGSVIAAAVSAVAGAAAAAGERWPLLGQVPVWAAASAASGGRLLAPGWPGGGWKAS